MAGKGIMLAMVAASVGGDSAGEDSAVGIAVRRAEETNDCREDALVDNFGYKMDPDEIEPKCEDVLKALQEALLSEEFCDNLSKLVDAFHNTHSGLDKKPLWFQIHDALHCVAGLDVGDTAEAILEGFEHGLFCKEKVEPWHRYVLTDGDEGTPRGKPYDCGFAGGQVLFAQIRNHPVCGFKLKTWWQSGWWKATLGSAQYCIPRDELQ